MKKFTTTIIAVAGLFASLSASALGIHEVLPGQSDAVEPMVVINSGVRFGPRTIQDYVGRDQLGSDSKANVAVSPEFGPRTIQDYIGDEV
ncbi:MAG: hypothetical protein ACR2P9_05015 [Gammaproteobacteria bacterium]